MKTFSHTNLKLFMAAMVAMAVPLVWAAAAGTAPSVTPAEARAIAKEAYIYGYPMVDNYRIQYAYYVDKNNPNFKAP
jgi:hypothetical protein